MLSSELRTAYLKFFESKGHLVHPSDSLVPDDPTLLYTSAGMVQFKPYFVGKRVPPAPRIVTSQKCIRTDDIDEVGDAVHHTFFEMLGNFSFGDYFKREAIIWAWEFLTQVVKFNPDHIWTSIYLDDDEAFNIWINEVGFPTEKIVRLGEDKNYWPADAPSKGPNGPCGPCNEIFLDTKPELGRPEDPAWSIAHDSNRFVEIWNLVFQQFDRQEDGTMMPLPTKNIDTGMGLERTIAILQGVESDYDTDLFLPIIRHIEKLSGAKYGSDEETTKSIRVVADHIRSAVFAIADGVMPSNVGRGYVLRRLIRNAVVKGRKLGLEKNFLVTCVPVVVELMGDVYHELADRQAHILKLVDSEEDKFRRTLESGLARLEEQIRIATPHPGPLPQGAREQERKLDGDAAFTLYDTFGFPLELTMEIAAEHGVRVDVEGFNTAMDEQRKRARESADFSSALFGAGGNLISELEKSIEPTKFVGYEDYASNSTIIAIVKSGELFTSAKEGDEIEVILDVTPFYAESGGQVGDIGEITSDGAALEVLDTVKASHFFLHKARIASGEVSVGDAVQCKVDKKRRLAIARNHSATHLLHAALHEIIGEHALQAGSVVDSSRLRFDFSHFQALTREELRAIETRVNELILEDVQTNVTITNIEEARKLGATMLFGEKYGADVRVVRMGEVSMELCGGTHLHHSSQICLFKLISESSIGAGLRRIEAVTGEAAVQYVHFLEDQLRETADELGLNPSAVVSAPEKAVQTIGGRARIVGLSTIAARARIAVHAEKEVDALKAKSAAEFAAERAGELADSAEECSGVKYVTERIPTVDVPTLQKLADGIADRLKSGVVVLAGVSDGKVIFVSKVTQDLVAKGFHAGNMLREVAKVAGGGGGGKPEFAQAGGKDASKVDEALAKAVEIIKTQAEAR